ncbi:MAG: STAS domain-containing protein [Thermoanaerobaculia bacterium]
MVVEKRTFEDGILLRVAGVIRLGESTAFFRQTLERALEEEGGDVLLDLSGINFIDSTGLGEMVGYLGRFQARGRRLALIRPSEPILQVLRVSRLGDRFSIYDSLEAAVAATGGKA